MSKRVKHLLLVTGMSGAGKSVTLHLLEDIGYYCIDNMPPVLLQYIDSLIGEASRYYNNIENFAIVVDSRSQDFEGMLEAISFLKKRSDLDIRLLFLECNDEVLTKRYKETRRIHPMAQQGSITKGIIYERSALKDIKELADYVIDTSYITSNQLKREIAERFEIHTHGLDVHIMSFGFKHGTPTDCDFIFDVRFLPNPFYIEELRHLTGLDQAVADYVMNNQETVEFINKTVDLLSYVIPKFTEISKREILIGIGCSGGQHRSVAIAEALNRILSQQFHARVWHRDLDKRKGF